MLVQRDAGQCPHRFDIANLALVGCAKKKRRSGAAPALHMSRPFDQVSLNSRSPSFSIEAVSLSPALSQTCLSLGGPEMTPSGVPVKIRSPGFSVKYRDA